jgi:hypothetical protein
MFTHKTNKSWKLLLKTWANQMVRFAKSDCPILLGPTTVSGAAGLRRGAPPPAKRHLDSGEVWTTATLEVEAAAKRSNWWKEKKTRKLGKNMKSMNLINCVDDDYNRPWPMFI